MSAPDEAVDRVRDYLRARSYVATDNRIVDVRQDGVTYALQAKDVDELVKIALDARMNAPATAAMPARSVFTFVSGATDVEVQRLEAAVGLMQLMNPGKERDLALAYLSERFG